MGLCCPEGCASAQCGRMVEAVPLGLNPKPCHLKNLIVQAWLLSGRQFLEDSSSCLSGGQTDLGRGKESWRAIVQEPH